MFSIFVLYILFFFFLLLPLFLPPSIRLYRAAYGQLLDSMFLNEDKLMEFKLIAGFLNCKVLVT